jgi:hypothetical protein
MVVFWFRLKKEGVMRSLEREELVPLKRCLVDLLDFVKELPVEEIPYFYKCIENMKHNLEICFLVQYEGWEQMEWILKRDWKAANHILLGIPEFDINAESPEEKVRLDCRFLELISNIEGYLRREPG